MSAIRPIFDFESVFDIDFTLIQLIQDKFKGSKYFNSVIDEDPITVRMLLRAREEYNPLSIIIKDEFKDSADNLYKEIVENFYKSIYKNISYTEISNLFTTLTIADKTVISLSMIVRNKFEEALAKSLQYRTNLELVHPYEVSLDKFDAYFAKSEKSIEENCPDIKSKTIFLLDYGFNVENFLGQIFPKKHIFEKYGEYNEIIISSVYSSLVYPEA